MAGSAFAERVLNLFKGLKFECLADVGREPADFGELDAAVLKVAMMVAALDGDVSVAELKSFEQLARRCRGYSAASAKEVFREGLKTAGYIELASRTLPDKDLLEAFFSETRRLLPRDFGGFEAKDVRRAFAMWTAMAMSDGDYSRIERRAITMLSDFVQDQVEASRNANSRRQGLSPAFAAAYHEKSGDDDALSPDFFRKAEDLLAKLNRASTALAAAKDLKNLILNG